MRRLFIGVLPGSLLLSLVLVVVCTVSVNVVLGAKPAETGPTVDAVTLVEIASDTQVTAMAPLNVYRLKVTASDVDTIDDIREIEFHIYHASDGRDWDADELAIYLWDKTAGWSMENGPAVTTWELLSADCIAPADFSATTGDWYLAFRPGKVAQADAMQNWFALATARDEGKRGSGSWDTGASMSTFSEIDFDVTAAVFGDVIAGIQPGSAGYITLPAANYLTVSVISNARYELGVKSDVTWGDGGSNILTLSESSGVPPGIAGFSLEIDDDEAGGSFPGEPRTPQAVTGTTTTISGYDAVARCTTRSGDSEGPNDHVMYMGMWLSLMGIEEVVYSGLITFTIINS